MSVRALKVLAVCTVIGVLLAAWALREESSSWGIEEHAGLIFPGLTENADSVERILIDGKNGRLTVKRMADGWVLEESDDYPVRAKAVQQTLLALSEMRRLEPKTKKKERLARLQLEDPASEDAKSKRIQLLTADGKRLADLIVGKENLLLQAISDGGVYVREPGKSQAWLASGEPAVGVEPRDWLENRILDIPRRRFERASVVHPNGDRLTIKRAAPDSDQFVLDGLSNGEKLINEYYPADIARALADLEMLEARKRHNVEFPDGKTIKAEFQTRDGLMLRLELARIDDQDWMRILAVTASPAGSSGAAKELEQEIAAIAARTKDWVYRLPEFESVHLKKRRAEIVERAKAGS